MDAGRANRFVARPAFVLAALPLLAWPSPAQAPPPSGWDAALSWEGERHGTLGPTGRRLFATRLEHAPGCRGSFHYGAAGTVLDDPILVEILRDGAALELEPLSTTWSPARVEQSWQADGLRLDEIKFVRGDDLVVDELTLTNVGAVALELEVHFRGGATPRRERGRSRQLPADLSEVATIAPVSGTPLFTARPAPEAVWVEAEAFEASAAVQPQASGGRHVSGFGAIAGARHLLVATAPRLERPSLILRYAHRGSTTARLSLEVDGVVAGRIELPASDGWSFASTPLSDLPAGRVVLALVAETAAAVDLDGLFLAEDGLDPGVLPATGAFVANVPEQLELFGGARTIDGVRYVLPAGAEVRRPSLVALRGGVEGDRARAFPERVTLPLSDVRPARATLHLLLRSEAPRGRRENARPAAITLRLDDGTEETIAWPASQETSADPSTPWPRRVLDALPASLRTRVELVAVEVGGLAGPSVQLSYDPPPGRSVARLELAAGDGPEVPVLLAATLEVPHETGRLPVLVGDVALEAQQVELVLAASDAVAARTPLGERSLVALVSLEPGESRRLRAVLSSGPRRTQTLLQALDAVADEGLVEGHLATSEAWFEREVPGFTCSDPWMEKAWRHRWALVRRNLLRLDLPDFSLPVVYEGTCCAEHARVAPRAASFALRELRWLRDTSVAQGTMRALLKRQRPDGLLFSVAPGPTRWEEVYIAHDLAASALGVWEITGSRQYLEEVLGLLQLDFEAALQRFDAREDEVPGPFLVSDESATGMPGRPSFRLAPPDEPVEAVELGWLLSSSALGLAKGHGGLGDEPQSRRMIELASALAVEARARSWDEEAGWFLSRTADGSPLRVREIAGLLPLALGLTHGLPPIEERARTTLLSADGFWAQHPLRSVASSDLVDRESRGSLSWDGPVHAEALTWAVDAFARAARLRRDEESRDRLRRLLDAATHLPFEGGDLERPVTREAWDPETGRGAGCVDVLRSTYADLLVQYVAGIVPRADGVLELDPLLTHLEHFRFAGLPHRGRLVNVTWDRPDGVPRYEDLGLPEGFTVEVDGVRRHHGEALGPVVVE